MNERDRQLTIPKIVMRNKERVARREERKTDPVSVHRNSRVETASRRRAISKAERSRRSLSVTTRRPIGVVIERDSDSSLVF